MPLATMKDLLVSHLNELHANERHLAELLPTLAKAASSQELADKLKAHASEAKEHGDITENAEYEDAKNEQAFIEGRIQTLSALIKNAVLIDEAHSTSHIQIGATVVLEGTAGRETYTIVGSTEASPADGRISNESPVGRALSPRGRRSPE